jgi:excisionase family DNA binding protein
MSIDGGCDRSHRGGFGSHIPFAVLRFSPLPVNSRCSYALLDMSETPLLATPTQARPGDYNPGNRTVGVGVLPRDEDELLTEEELAKELKVSSRTLQRWRHEGRGPRWRRVGKGARYRRGDVQAWLDAQEGGSGVPPTEG